LIFGAIGLAFGLAIIILIAATSVIRAVFRRQSSKKDADNVVEGEHESAE
jgi:hypothetical protein